MLFVFKRSALRQAQGPYIKVVWKSKNRKENAWLVENRDYFCGKDVQTEKKPKFAVGIHQKLFIMKKLVLLIGIVIFSMNVFAQSKGERYIATSLTASFEMSKYKIAYFNQEYEETEPGNFSIIPYVEYGRFANDNFRLSFAMGFPFRGYPQNAEWDFNKMFGVSLNPNMGFYIPITDRFYYAPEIGLSYELGLYGEDDFYLPDYRLYNIFLAYINAFAFEFRVTEKVGIAVQMGEIGYSFSKILGSSVLTRQFYAYFNSGMITARFYF